MSITILIICLLIGILTLVSRLTIGIDFCSFLTSGALLYSRFVTHWIIRISDKVTDCVL